MSFVAKAIQRPKKVSSELLVYPAKLHEYCIDNHIKYPKYAFQRIEDGTTNATGTLPIKEFIANGDCKTEAKCKAAAAMLTKLEELHAQVNAVASYDQAMPPDNLNISQLLQEFVLVRGLPPVKFDTTDYWAYCDENERKKERFFRAKCDLDGIEYYADDKVWANALQAAAFKMLRFLVEKTKPNSAD